MKCDHCDNEATVHEVTVHKGHKQEKHLCESCAKQDGIASYTQVPINALLSKFVMATGAVQTGVTRSCPACGMTFVEFRKRGLLGCSQCYDAFEELLGPLIERAQEGGSQHIGKTPTRAGAGVDRGRTLTALRKQLEDAIAAEHYEQAAQLRDEMRSLGQSVGVAASDDDSAEQTQENDS